MNDRKVAYLLYKDGVSQKDIAKYFSKTEQTVCDWKKKDRWEDNAMEEEIHTRTVQEDAGVLLRYQLGALKRIMEGLIEEEKADNKPRMIGKGYIDGIRDLYNMTKPKEVEWSIYVRIIRELARFLKDEDITLAQQITPLLDAFINNKREAK